MIAVENVAFAAYLEDLGYSPRERSFVGHFNHRDVYAYIYNENKRIRQLKELFDQGTLGL